MKTNQKGVPLWSVGASWQLSSESSYSLALLPYQRFRVTYGSSGNVNKSVSAYPTVKYSTYNQLPVSQVTSIGNLGLRWEQVKTLNLGWDFRFSGDRLGGSLEYYRKQANDLIGIDYMAPSTGIIGTTGNLQNKINYANLKTAGLDLRLSGTIIKRKFSWQATVLASYVRNRITHFNTRKDVAQHEYFGGTVPPRVGFSRDVIYAIPWHGLSPVDGKPIIHADDPMNRDYQAFMDGLKPEDLLDVGVKIAPYHGSLRNTFRFGNLELNALLLWKVGSRFRRNSITPGDEYLTSWSYHQDYFKRWKSPGDEFRTNVPAQDE